MGTHIVWDWNGTLFDDVTAVYEAACEVFAAHGLPPVSFEAYRAAYARPISLFYTRLFGGRLDDVDFSRLDRDFHDAYRRRMTGCGLAAGAAETLAAWRRRGGSQSLLSMWRHDELVPFVRRCGIATEFARIDGLDGPGGGRKAAHLTDHLAALRADPTQVVLVGDSLDDVDAAGAAGAACVLYDGGYHVRAALDSAGVPVVTTLQQALRAIS